MVVALYWSFTVLGRQYKLLYLGRTTSYGKSIGKALFQKWYYIRVATYSGGNIFIWRCIGNTLDQSGTVLGWQRILMILYRGGSEAKLNWIEMAPYRGGTGSKWHCSGLLLYRIGNVYGWFCIGITLYWGGAVSRRHWIKRHCIGLMLYRVGNVFGWFCMEVVLHREDIGSNWHWIKLLLLNSN